MPWTFYNANGQRLSSAATNISVLDIDGATEMGADIIDADLLIIDDGAGGTNRSVLASRIKTYAGTTQAVQSDIEAETNQDTYVPPDLIRHSPGVAKAYGSSEDSGLRSGSYNVTSSAKDATGKYTWTWADDFADTLYIPVTNPESGVGGGFDINARATGTATFWSYNNAGSLVNSGLFVAAFGDQ